MHLDIASGGEYLLPFARKKLQVLKQQLADTGQTIGNRFVVSDSGATVFVRTIKVGSIWIDTIRITAESGWDFLIYDQSTDRSSVVVWLAAIGKPNFSKAVTVSGTSRPLTNMTPVRTDDNCMFIIPDNGAWKFVDKSKTAKNYLLDATTLTSVPVSFDAESKKLVVYKPTGVQSVPSFSDGTTQIAVNNLNAVSNHATKTDGFFVTFDNTKIGVGVPVQITSLSQGLTMNITLPSTATSGVGTSIANYTDIFLGAFDDPTGTIKRHALILRGAGIDFTSTNFSASGGTGSLHVCSSSAIHVFIDLDNRIGAATFPGVPVTARMVAIRGVRNTDGSYTYTETVALIDNDFSADASSAVFALATSVDTGYAFVFYQTRSGGIGTGKIIGSDGTVTAVPLGLPGGLFPLTAFGALQFKTRACLVANVQGTGGFFDTVMFTFSDGALALPVMPGNTANTSFRDTGFCAGSQTIAYAYVSVKPQNSPTGLAQNYLLDSTGSSILLTLPTNSSGVQATSVTVQGFVEQKAGCRLVFTASYPGGAPRSYHHWDETGTILTYATPAFVNISPTLGAITLPTPSSIHRMMLVDKWD